MTDADLAIAAVGKADLDSTSRGAALGAGFDYGLDKSLFLGVDVKKVPIGSEAYLDGCKVPSGKIAPIFLQRGHFLRPGSSQLTTSVIRL